MIGRKVVDFFAHQCGARDQLVAEREVVLTYALHLLSHRGVLDRLAFKGGTALRKLVFGAGGRFSEDLDFTLRAGEKEDAALALLDALDGKTHHGITFGTTDFYETDGSFATFVTYRHSWNDKGRFKLDVTRRRSPAVCTTSPGSRPRRPWLSPVAPGRIQRPVVLVRVGGEAAAGQLQFVEVDADCGGHGEHRLYVHNDSGLGRSVPDRCSYTDQVAPGRRAD